MRTHKCGHLSALIREAFLFSVDGNKCREKENMKGLVLHRILYHSPSPRAQGSLRKREQKDYRRCRCLQLHTVYMTSTRPSQPQSQHRWGKGAWSPSHFLHEGLLAAGGCWERESCIFLRDYSAPVDGCTPNALSVFSRFKRRTYEVGRRKWWQRTRGRRF